MKKNPYPFKFFYASSHDILAKIITHEKFQFILDIGCGQGFLGYLLPYQPKILIGIDLSIPHRLPKKYTSLYSTDLEKNSLSFLKNRIFDVILLGDILEHLERPSILLSSLRSHLNKKGCLLISVPNMDFFLVRLLFFFRIRPKTERGLFDKTHLHDFNQKKISQLLIREKYKIELVTVTPVPLPRLTKQFDKGGIFYWIYALTYKMAKKYPSLFAYQIIIKAKLE